MFNKIYNQTSIFNYTTYILSICCKHIFYILINTYTIVFVLQAENEELQSNNKNKQQHSALVQVRGRPRNSLGDKDTARRRDLADGFTVTDQLLVFFAGKTSITNITKLDENSP